MAIPALLGLLNIPYDQNLLPNNKEFTSCQAEIH